MTKQYCNIPALRDGVQLLVTRGMMPDGPNCILVGR